MPTVTTQPSVIPPSGIQPKLIEEYVGRIATKDDTVSIARIICPPGWTENGQQPKFAETKVVLKSKIQVKHQGGVFEVLTG